MFPFPWPDLGFECLNIGDGGVDSEWAKAARNLYGVTPNSVAISSNVFNGGRGFLDLVLAKK